MSSTKSVINPDSDPAELTERIRGWAQELGFARTGIAGIDLKQDEQKLNRWLELGRHGEMHYMARHGNLRSRPAELVPGTVRVISVCMDYLLRAPMIPGRLSTIVAWATYRAMRSAAITTR